ncbi:hypothetical protein QCA50_020431 [Cerrena zonata]|uniref:Uncharacterized protein n=1 Tax=Cerrena zonata TaxID=2478898 RepID=A0AAW0FHE7_9APHY
MLAILPTTSLMLKSELPKLLATGNLTHPTLNASIHSQNVSDTTSSSTVTYRLIGRVLYKIAQQSKSQSSHHWTAQFLIGDQTFLYDDCRDQGIMKAIGEPSILETQSYLASMWIYHRVTENAWIERGVETVTVSQAEPNTPPKDAINVESSQVQVDCAPSTDEDKTSETHERSATEVEDIEDIFHINSPNNLSKMAWSSSDDEEPSFSVSTGTWNDSMLGSFGLFPTNQRSRHVYPSVIIDRDANDPTLPNIEWYYGNSYRRGEKPTTRFLHLSLEACGKLLTNQREFGGYYLSML